MDMFAQRLQDRAKQLGISNAEAARRVGLDERRYAHYASGKREPDLATVLKIAVSLSTSPNWLLGFVEPDADDPVKMALVERLFTASTAITNETLELLAIQAEAVAKFRAT